MSPDLEKKKGFPKLNGSKEIDKGKIAAKKVVISRKGGRKVSKENAEEEDSRVLSARSVYKLTERPVLGRTRSWRNQSSGLKRNLNDVFLQFDYDNEGSLNVSKIRALFMRYGPKDITDDLITYFFRRYRDAWHQIDFEHFVMMISHAQESYGIFTECFQPASESCDVLGSFSAQRRSFMVKALCGKPHNQNKQQQHGIKHNFHKTGQNNFSHRASNTSLNTNLPKSLTEKNLFQGLRSSHSQAHHNNPNNTINSVVSPNMNTFDVGSTLLSAVMQFADKRHEEEEQKALLLKQQEEEKLRQRRLPTVASVTAAKRVVRRYLHYVIENRLINKPQSSHKRNPPENNGLKKEIHGMRSQIAPPKHAHNPASHKSVSIDTSHADTSNTQDQKKIASFLNDRNKKPHSTVLRPPPHKSKSLRRNSLRLNSRSFRLEKN